MQQQQGGFPMPRGSYGHGAAGAGANGYNNNAAAAAAAAAHMVAAGGAPGAGFGAPRADYPPQQQRAVGPGSGARGPPGANLYINNIDPNVHEETVRRSYAFSFKHAPETRH